MRIVMFISFFLFLICASLLIINEWKENPRFKSFVIANAKQFIHAPLQFTIVIALDVYIGVHYEDPIVFLSFMNMIVVGYRVSEMLKHASVQTRVFHAKPNFMPQLPELFPAEAMLEFRNGKYIVTVTA